jgi:radical SAM protein with 4Fe4S-binding SPASM domain
LLHGHGLYSITVSLDGTGKNHNWLRCRPDSFERAHNALRLLSHLPECVKDVVTCVNPRNIDELDAIARILIDTGVISWRLFRIFPAGRARNNDELLLSVSQTRKMLDWIGDRRRTYRHDGLDLSYSCEGWLPFSVDPQLRSRPFFCRAGINIASILHDGTITGCSNNSTRFYEGNIIEDSFAYVWRNRFGQFRNRDWVKATACGECRHVRDCRGSSIHLWREDSQRPEFCYMDCYN